MEYLTIRRNEVLIYTACLSLENALSGKEPVTKDYIPHDYIYMKCQERGNP